MQAIELRNYGGLGLAIAERRRPHPGPEQVLIEMRAAALNYRDLLIIQGAYSPHLRLPLIPVSDGVGSVIAVGEQVTQFKPGDRVAGIFVQNWLSGDLPEGAPRTLGLDMDGMLTQYTILHQNAVVRVPEHLTDEEAATLPCAAVTAWNALMVQDALKPGETVLIQGTGGVALFALQFAMLAGARPILLSSSDERLEQARGLGAAEGINYKRVPEWDQEVLKLTDGKGVDHVVEVGGGATLARSLNAVRVGGHISVIGILSGISAELSMLTILMKQVRIQGVFVGSRRTFERMNDAIALHKLRPVVGRVFPFEAAREAFTYLEKRDHVGKIAIRF